MALGPDLWRSAALPDGAVRRGRARGRSLLRVAHRGLRVRRRAARGDEAGPALPDAPARGQAGVLLLPDVQAPHRRPTTGTRSTSRSARRLMNGHGAVGRTFRGRVLQLDHRLDRPRRLGVGRDPLRRPPRRPEGVRLRDALRRGLGPLRGVRALLHRHGRRPRGRARPCPAGAVDADATAAGDARRACAAELDRRSAGSVVAFSGGADSAFLAQVATDVLGPDRRPVRHRRLALARTRGARRLPGPGRGVGSALAGGRRPTSSTTPHYVANGPDRCYHCKTELMEALAPMAEAEGATVVLGVNLDDLGDHRPGQAAASERGARFPLGRRGPHQGRRARVGPAGSACAPGTSPPPPVWPRASPYGTPVTLGTLRSRWPGRVRAPRARLRAAPGAPLRRPGPHRARRRRPRRRCWPGGPRSSPAVRAAGYRYVTLDLEGFRSGNLNDASWRRRRAHERGH